MPKLFMSLILAPGHTGYEDVAADREGVTRVFTNRRVIEAIREPGIELISYSDLVRTRTTAAARG